MTTNSVETQSPAAEAQGIYRWVQLALGLGCMAMVANLQYGWTLFVDPINQKYHPITNRREEIFSTC